MNKCEWIDGGFSPCKGFKHKYHAITQSTNTKEEGVYFEKVSKDRKLKFCPYCGANIEKRVKIKVGMFGKFWNEFKEDACYVYDILDAIDNDEYHYLSSSQWWKHFTPGLPEGFNKDGTPK
jgi:hypothetical protein